MQRLAVLIALFVPSFADAVSDPVASMNTGFVSSLYHPFISPDFLIAALLVAALTLMRYRGVIWLPPALFASLVGLGFLLGMTGLAIPYTAIFLVLSALALGVQLVAGKLMKRTPCLLMVAVMGGLLGHYSSQLAGGAELGLSMYGLGLSLGTGTLMLVMMGLAWIVTVRGKTAVSE